MFKNYKMKQQSLDFTSFDHVINSELGLLKRGTTAISKYFQLFWDLVYAILHHRVASYVENNRSSARQQKHLTLRNAASLSKKKKKKKTHAVLSHVCWCWLVENFI